MWSFLWRPGWVLTHLLVITMVVVMVSLGFWQLSRLGERRSTNATIEARQDNPPVTMSELLPAGPASGGAEADAVAFRPVVLEGTYLVADQVLIRNRSLGGSPGYWALTPLLLADGTGAVAVNRGWLPFAGTDPEGAGWDAFDPPAGRVVITGFVREVGLGEAGLESFSGSAGEAVSSMPRVDLQQLSQQVDASLYPVYVDLVSQDPVGGELPVPVPPPELSEGSHLGYAGQWFIFSILTVVVYAVMLRRASQGKAKSAPVEPEEAVSPAENGVRAQPSGPARS